MPIITSANRVRLLASIALSLALLSACGTTGTSGSAETGNVSAQAASPAAVTQATPSATNPAGTPLAALPTPNSDGLYHVTFAQAQRIAPFPLTMPAWIPPSLTLTGVNLFSSLKQHFGSGTPWISYGPPNLASLFFDRRTAATPGASGTPTPSMFGIELDETTLGLGGNGVSSNDFSTPTTLTINGFKVRRMTRISGPPLTVYSWQASRVVYTIEAVISRPLTEADVEHMIASMAK